MPDGTDARHTAARALTDIDQVEHIMTGGANGTKTFLMNILDTAFKYNKYGVASSMSLVLLAVVLLVAVLQKLVIGKEEAE